MGVRVEEEVDWFSMKVLEPYTGGRATKSGEMEMLTTKKVMGGKKKRRVQKKRTRASGSP